MTSEQPQLLSVRCKPVQLWRKSSTLTHTAATRPQISRTQSHQSSAITGEYFSDYASEVSSQRSDQSEASYETPPSRISTPVVQLPPSDSEMTLPQRPDAARPARLQIRTTAQAGNPRALPNLDDMSPPTPGIDDLQFIRFALDQLTRDEDVLGGRESTADELELAISPSMAPG